MSVNSRLIFFTPDPPFSEGQHFVSSGIKAGFPSPAADFEENKISLDKIVVKNGATTFYAKASGDSMVGAGIDDGDILVIDRSLEPKNNKIAICLIDGGFTVKRISQVGDELYLLPENSLYQPIKIEEFNDFLIWGIVTYVVKKIA